MSLIVNNESVTPLLYKERNTFEPLAYNAGKLYNELTDEAYNPLLLYHFGGHRDDQSYISNSYVHGIDSPSGLPLNLAGKTTPIGSFSFPISYETNYCCISSRDSYAGYNGLYFPTYESDENGLHGTFSGVHSDLENYISEIIGPNGYHYHWDRINYWAIGEFYAEQPTYPINSLYVIASTVVAVPGALITGDNIVAKNESIPYASGYSFYGIGLNTDPMNYMSGGFTGSLTPPSTYLSIGFKGGNALATIDNTNVNEWTASETFPTDQYGRYGFNVPNSTPLSAITADHNFHKTINYIDNNPNNGVSSKNYTKFLDTDDETYWFKTIVSFKYDAVTDIAGNELATISLPIVGLTQGNEGWDFTGDLTVSAFKEYPNTATNYSLRLENATTLDNGAAKFVMRWLVPKSYKLKVEDMFYCVATAEDPANYTQT